ncbi:unnamed protein product [Polarella glacialis]|uniref:Fungal lipase-type domain-containing protein n=1 Tax=Polarella glacialis TaxID=89957 RepID=A0A813HZ83_POLGL|nr:unnamed protein product [Polarella glacialis]CAE8688172.1 unnamed protein product [Polarella glacialis]
MVCWLCAVFFSAAAAASEPYSEAASREYVLLNQAASLKDWSALQTWTCGPTCEAAGNVTDVRILSNSAENTFGFAGRYQGDCVVAFRGTKNPENVLVDLDFGQIELELAENQQCAGGCKVHAGFSRAWRSLRYQTETALRDLGCAGAGQAVRLTGHSLGGAMAALAAWDLSASGYNVSQVYTYGEPRLGNSAWVSAFQDLMANKSFYRVVHYKDPVPHFPSELFNYRHAAPEVYYSTQVSGPYTVCNSGEESRCSDQWNLFETMFHACLHCSYLGMNPCDPGAMQPKCSRRLGSDLSDIHV